MLAMMSDFNETPSVPAPPTGSTPSPFGAPSAPPPPASYGAPAYGAPAYGAPGFPVGGVPAQKLPRPAVTVGAGMLVLGGVLLIVGSFITWFSILGESYTGFSSGDSGSKDGPVFLFFGVVVLAFGIVQLMARKVLAIGILAIVMSALALLAALADIGDVRDAVDLADSIGIDASSGPGLWVILIGALIALAGSIATVAKRRA